MNNTFIGAAIGLFLALTSCNQSQGVFPVGIPTLNVEKNETIAKNSDTNEYDWTLAINIYARPGSPSGRFIGLRLGDGRTFTLPKVVNRCAITETDACPNGTVTFKDSYPTRAQIPGGRVVGLVVAGDNDIDAVIYTTPFNIGGG
jgi:hypothetical protein